MALKKSKSNRIKNTLHITYLVFITFSKGETNSIELSFQVLKENTIFIEHFYLRRTY
jgi:hypothetical protein